MNTVLVVDNEKSMREFLTIMLEKEGYAVDSARNGVEAAKLLNANDYSVVLTDIKMPRASGIDVLETVNKRCPNTPVIMMTAFATAETAVEAMKKGAFDYIAKPFNIEDLQLVLKNAVDKKRLADENVELKNALRDKYRLDNIIGKSAVMQKVFDYVCKVANSNATVLILGESGTGKELVARALHYNSPRKNFPFVSINCGAVPENLLESELFGHEKGAFTSADSTKQGLMESANKGTFFLDEVYEAPLTIQVKLLRVLQEMELMRVGGTKPIKVDLRIIAATNQDLEKSVRDKTFREDLYYRLKVVPIILPPLRDRIDDIPLLVEHFIEKFNAQHAPNRQIKGILPDALKCIEKYHWPGNVRELENVIERAVVLEVSDQIQVSSLPEELTGVRVSEQPVLPAMSSGDPIDLENTLDEIEKNMLIRALNQSDGIINKAAARLNLSFRSMRYRLQKHKLRGK